MPGAGLNDHADFRLVCERCLRPASVCVCSHVQTIDTRTSVLILQHPRERKVGVNTARLAHLSLPNSVLRIGLDFSHDQLVQATLADPQRQAALLFPGKDAIDVAAHPPDRPVHLIVLDGTWSQASKLLRANPVLARLPRYVLSPDQPSRYRIRTQPADYCVSTIEALASVLAVLERQPSIAAALLAPFDAMVQRQLEYARESGFSSRHARLRPSSDLRPWQWFVWRKERIVLVAGETNEWPRDARQGLPEIIHWAAVRPATGDTFEAVVRPRGRLAPSCPVQIELPVQRIEGGLSWEEFQSRWSAFVSGDQLVCLWGKHAGDVAVREGLSLERRIDLRSFSIKHVGRRLGEPEAYARELGAEPVAPRGQGRAWRRLAVVEAIAGALMKRLER